MRTIDSFIKERNTRIQQTNDTIFKERQMVYDAIQGIRIGDYVLEPGGKYTRVTHVWHDEQDQPESAQVGGSKYGSFYLGNGHASYSGGLDPSLPVKELYLIDRGEMGRVWFFSEDRWGAGRGVDYEMSFRVFEHRPTIA